jgi:hypothetical protein
VYFLDCSRIFLTNLVTVKVFMTFITECSSILKKKNVAFQKRFTYFEQKSCNVLKKSCACVYKEKYDFWKKNEHFYFGVLFIKVLFISNTVYRDYCFSEHYCLSWLLFTELTAHTVAVHPRALFTWGHVSPWGRAPATKAERPGGSLLSSTITFKEWSSNGKKKFCKLKKCHSFEKNLDNLKSVCEYYQSVRIFELFI